MKLRSILTCSSLAMLLAAVDCAPLTSTSEAPAPVRVGVFDSRGVALAYGRSARPDCMLAKVAAIREEHGQATADGDLDRAEELETEAVDLQDQIHRQVFSGAPIPQILALIEADLPGVAEAAKVELIITEALYRGPEVELVDITMEMCAPFAPDDETREMIVGLLDQPPVPESELRRHH